MFRGPLFTEKDLVDLLSFIKDKDFSIKDGSGIIEEFESSFGQYLNAKHALATNNGTSAIHSALFGLGLQKGDEVIVPCFGWHACISPMLQMGIRPVFCNIDQKTYNIDPDDAVKKITEKTKAIFVIHLFGHPADMDSIMGSEK